MAESKSGFANGNGDEQNGAPKYVSEDSNLGALESPTKPWYISTKAIYRIVNKAAHSIYESDEALFDQAMFGLSTVIDTIKDKTGNSSLVINLESASTLIEKLDDLRSDQFIIHNDGLDPLRGRLAVALRNLIACVTDQKNMAADFLSQRAHSKSDSDTTMHTVEPVNILKEQLDTIPRRPQIPSIENAPVDENVKGLLNEQLSSTDDAATSTNTIYDRTMAYLEPVLDQVKTQAPETYEKLSSAVKQLQEAVNNKRNEIVATANTYSATAYALAINSDALFKIKGIQALQRAQPYVHSAYDIAMPKINAALQRMRPYLEPLMARAQEALRALQNNAILGPHLQYFLDRLYLAIELAKLYCALGDPNLAVGCVVSSVPMLNDVVPPTPQAIGQLASASPGTLSGVADEAKQAAGSAAKALPESLKGTKGGAKDETNEVSKGVFKNATKDQDTGAARDLARKDVTKETGKEGGKETGKEGGQQADSAAASQAVRPTDTQTAKTAADTAAATAKSAAANPFSPSSRPPIPSISELFSPSKAKSTAEARPPRAPPMT